MSVRIGALRARRPTAAAALAALIMGTACAAPTPSPSATQRDVRPAGWRALPDGPLSARYDAVAFWTGSEVIVLGGNDGLPCPPNADCARPAGPALRDGAAFDPSTDTWRSLSDAPISLGSVDGALVDGILYLLVVDVAPNGVGQETFLGYDIAGDRWEELPPPPGDEPHGAIVAMGTAVVAFRRSQESGPGVDVVYDPASRTWTDLPLDPLAPAFDRSLVWTEVDVVLLGIPLDPRRPPDAAPVYGAAVFDAEVKSWQRLPDSEVVSWNPTWFAAGGSIVNPSIGSANGGEVNNWGREYPFGGILTPPAQWSPLPPLPPGGGQFQGPAAGGGEYAVSSEGWALHVPSGTWVPISRLPERIDAGAAAVWAGDELVLFGGVRWDEGMPTLLKTAWAWRP